MKFKGTLFTLGGIALTLSSVSFAFSPGDMIPGGELIQPVVRAVEVEKDACGDRHESSFLLCGFTTCKTKWTYDCRTRDGKSAAKIEVSVKTKKISHGSEPIQVNSIKVTPASN